MQMISLLSSVAGLLNTFDVCTVYDHEFCVVFMAKKYMFMIVCERLMHTQASYVTELTV